MEILITKNTKIMTFLSTNLRNEAFIITLYTKQDIISEENKQPERQPYKRNLVFKD